MKLNEINDTSLEGKLLMGALAIITTAQGFTNKTPDEVLAMVESTAKVMYDFKAMVENDALVAQPFKMHIVRD